MSEEDAARPPWLLHADADLLAVAKPAGVTTHRSGDHTQLGFYEWTQEQRNERLALLHRLDKETSGLLLLGRSERANRRVTEQLSERRVRKRYLLLVPHDPRRPARLRCDHRVPQKRSRRGDREALTEFTRVESGRYVDLMEARPHTGRRHQVRLHAARLGMPILGDGEYGGRPAARLFLHAAGVELDHPAGGPLRLEAPLPESFRLVLGGARPDAPRVAARAAWEARAPLFAPQGQTGSEAWLWIDRRHDGFPELRVERLGEVLLVKRSDERTDSLSPAWQRSLQEVAQPRALWELRRPRRGAGGPARLVAGESEARFSVQEQGLSFWIDLAASPTSSGLFLDQRATRRRLLGADRRGQRVLNAFAHTGSLSVAAARAGAETLTLDLSRRYLDWARENLRLNGLDPAEHDFVYGDALDWLRRFAKKQRRFELVLLDPPSFSQSGKGRRKRSWSVERDLGLLVERGARLVAREGSLFVSTNLRRLRWERFAEGVRAGLRAAGRRGELEASTLPVDFRSGAGDPPYLKAAWIRLD